MYSNVLLKSNWIQSIQFGTAFETGLRKLTAVEFTTLQNLTSSCIDSRDIVILNSVFILFTAFLFLKVNPNDLKKKKKKKLCNIHHFRVNSHSLRDNNIFRKSWIQGALDVSTSVTHHKRSANKRNSWLSQFHGILRRRPADPQSS